MPRCNLAPDLLLSAGFTKFVSSSDASFCHDGQAHAYDLSSSSETSLVVESANMLDADRACNENCSTPDLDGGTLERLHEEDEASCYAVFYHKCAAWC